MELIEKNDVCIVINTCKQYSYHINELIKQINLHNTIFPKENIIIISGQEDENSIDYVDGIKYVKVMYTGIHLTSSIYINENITEYNHINYWVFLPDTIQFGNKFFINIFNYYNEMIEKQLTSLPFINPILRPSMDLGMIHTKHLINISDYLKKMKLIDINKNSLLNLKKQLIYDENIFLGLPATCYNISTKFNYLTNNTQPSIFITNYNSELDFSISLDNTIHCVYFKKIDLYKYQRNFKGPNAELIIAM